MKPINDLKSTIFFILLFIYNAVFANDNEGEIIDTTTGNTLETFTISYFEPINFLNLLSCTDIPSLNRLPFIFRGSPQPTTTFFINGFPIYPFSDYTIGTNQNYQQVFSPNSSATGYYLPFNPFPDAPIFFEGYSSWFSKSTASRIFEIYPSYHSIEYGNFSGAFIDVKREENFNSIDINVDFNNREAFAGFSVPYDKKFLFGLSGRYGFNDKEIRKWIEPYTYHGDIVHDKTNYLDFSIYSKLKTPFKTYVTFSGYSVFENLNLGFSDTMMTEKSSKHLLGSILFNSKISDNFQNEFLFGGISAQGKTICQYVERFSSLSYLYLKEKIILFPNEKIINSVGIDFVKHFGEYNQRRGFDPIWQITPNYIRDNRSNIGLWYCINLVPVKKIAFNAGIRLDKYIHLSDTCGGIISINPTKSIKKKSPIDISYRVKTSANLYSFFNISVFSGTYNQSPTPSELYHNDKLRSVKSTKNGFSFFGIFPFGLFYQTDFYLHELWDLPVINPNTQSTFTMIPDGELKSKGIEFALKHEQNQYISGLMAYAISKDEQRDINYDKWERAPFDRRHKISGLIKINIPFGLEIIPQFIFTSGMPIRDILNVVYIANYNTYEPIYGDLVDGEKYFKFNLQANYSFIIKNVNFNLYGEIFDLFNNGIGENEGYNFDYSEGQFIQNIDKRQFAFGIRVDY